MTGILARAEAQLDLKQRFRIARARAKRLIAKKQPFDESEHPRDEDGKWTSGGGSVAEADSGPVLQKGPLPTQSIIIKSGEGTLQAERHDVEVLLNPTASMASSLMRSEGKPQQMRYMTDNSGNLYTWLAGHAIHLEVILPMKRMSGGEIKFDKGVDGEDAVAGGRLHPYFLALIGDGLKNAEKYAAKKGKTFVVGEVLRFDCRLLNRDAHSDWMDECVPELMTYGKDQTVAIAACLNMWRDAWEESHPDGADDPGPSRPGNDKYDDKQWQSARALLKEWDESKHPRVPAGGPDGGQFGEGGGGGATGDTSSSKKPGKSKKPAKKEDFDKAKISIRTGGSTAAEQEFIDKWNEKIGIEPEAFKKNFLGGVDATMSIVKYGDKFNVTGEIEGTGSNKGRMIGNYEREIDPNEKRAYSAYFKLEKAATRNDTGKKVLAGNIEMYQQIGIERVEVSANIDVGGYAWAKYGYVPTAQSWAALRTKLEEKLGGEPSRRPTSSSGNTMEADDWDMLPSDVQDDVRDKWMRDSYEEFLSSEVQNWRDSGQAKSDAKAELAYAFDQYPDLIPEWVNTAIDEVREKRKEDGKSDIPYSNLQIYQAIDLNWESYHGDGSDDPKIEFDNDKLAEPSDYDPAQGTLPGIEPHNPAEHLTEEMRDKLTNKLIKVFDDTAEERADDMEPPSFLADSVSEYQDDYWGSKSDREKLQHAVDYGMADIEIEPDEDDEEEPAPVEEEPQLDLPKDKDPLLEALHSTDPKSIWKIADSSRGKELLLNTNWSGVLNLKDKATMDRFNKYVGRAA